MFQKLQQSCDQLTQRLTAMGRAKNTSDNDSNNDDESLKFVNAIVQAGADMLVSLQKLAN